MNEFIIIVKAKFGNKDRIEHIYIEIDKMIENGETLYDIIYNGLEEIDESYCGCTFSEAQNHCDCNCGNWSGEFEILSKHQIIGIKDINNLNIIPDCSIVEFDFIYIETIGRQSDKVKVRGYFTFNSETSAYDLAFFHNWVDSMPNYHINIHMQKEDIKRASNFKIIDTMQQNKLGLIKAKHDTN